MCIKAYESGTDVHTYTRKEEEEDSHTKFVEVSD